MYPGADDNASGVAALVEIARAFAASGRALKRTVNVGFWTGEEEGHLGVRALRARPGVAARADAGLSQPRRNRSPMNERRAQHAGVGHEAREGWRVPRWNEAGRLHRTRCRRFGTRPRTRPRAGRARHGPRASSRLDRREERRQRLSRLRAERPPVGAVLRNYFDGYRQPTIENRTPPRCSRWPAWRWPRPGCPPIGRRQPRPAHPPSSASNGPAGAAARRPSGARVFSGGGRDSPARNGHRPDGTGPRSAVNYP